MGHDAFVRSWLNAFNRGDLEAILAHYAPGIHHVSPTVRRLLGRPDGAVDGIADLRSFYEVALKAAGPGLTYTLRSLHDGVGGCTIVYGRSGGKLVAETFLFDDDGRITWSFVAHAEAAAPESA